VQTRDRRKFLLSKIGRAFETNCGIDAASDFQRTFVLLDDDNLLVGARLAQAFAVNGEGGGSGE
jgi:hypothetical protein